jgi:hypothetical protein
MRAAILIGVAWCAAALGQEVAPDVLLGRIREHMTENLNRMPNYTCTETIDRSVRRGRHSQSEPLERVRLEVALVGPRELYAWPGAREFEEKEIGEFVKGAGAISTGSFALHARAVFLSPGPQFTWRGEESKKGAHTYRCDYQVKRASSNWSLHIGARQGIVGYHGSFWVDRHTLDVLRLEVTADDIPPDLAVESVANVIEYRRIRIGDSDFVLPHAGDLTLDGAAGNESRTRTTFSSCRQYSGESVLSFADPPPDAAAAPQVTVKRIQLPPGTLLDVRLRNEITPLNSAVGDPIAGEVTADVKDHGTVLVPKGARAAGRITELRRVKGPVDYVAVTLQISSVEFGNTRAEFHAVLQGWQRTEGVLGRRGGGTLYVRAIPPKYQIPAGLVTTWLVQP